MGKGRGPEEGDWGEIKEEERRNKQDSVIVYTLGCPFLASSQELLVARLTNQQLLSSEVLAKKR